MYIRQPEGFQIKGKEDHCYRVKKLLYGIDGASRGWQKEVTKTLKDIGFKSCMSDECVFVKWTGDKVTIACVHVDDFAIATNDQKFLDYVDTEMCKKYKFRKEPFHEYVGFQMEF